MRRLWYVASKELLQNRRDWLAALFTVVLPVVFTFFLGLILGGADRDTFPLAIADEDGSPVSERLVGRLEDSALLELQESTADQIDQAVQDQKVAAGLIIPKGFGASVAAGGQASLELVRIETSSGAQSVEQAVRGVVSEFNAGLLAARTAAQQVAAAAHVAVDDALLDEATRLAESQLAFPRVAVSVIDASTLTAATAGGFDQSSTGGLVNWVLFGIMGVATTTVWERRRGLLRRLKAAGVGAASMVGGKVLAMLIITFLQQLLLVLVGQFALGVGYFADPLALFLTMVSLSALAATVGLLISMLFRSEQAVIATTVISAQMLAALGGAWFPLEITSPGFSHFAHVLPTAWVMDSLHGIVLSDWGVTDVLLPLAIVWAWIIAVFSLSVWRYRPD